MRAVDTNVLVRLLTRDDPEQFERAERFIEGGVFVSHLVIMEAIWVLETGYSVNVSQIAAALDMILNHRDFAVQEPEVVAAALARFTAKPSVGFSDCLILEVARRAGHLPLGTFDRSLGKMEGTAQL